MVKVEGAESAEIHQIHYNRVKGIIESYVATASKPLNEVAKTIQTSLKNEEVDSSELKRIFFEVENKSVEAFSSHHSYAGRRKRFEDLKKGLCLEN
ncbi:MAG: hypothetical protein O8C64_02185 [Candidatus Methanoperedens sp.]|nr:hypothetical protein [Candidatus Methanoperedens sp.]MCZ7403803.1 hypothetical protein [Candidatus Methanoperedens sp.]